MLIFFQKQICSKLNYNLLNQGLKHKYVICSCNTTITTVKKYIASKIYSNKDLYKEIDIVYNDEIVSGKDHTLKFVLFTSGKIQVNSNLFN